MASGKLVCGYGPCGDAALEGPATGEHAADQRGDAREITRGNRPAFGRADAVGPRPNAQSPGRRPSPPGQLAGAVPRSNRANHHRTVDSAKARSRQRGDPGLYFPTLCEGGLPPV